MPLKSYADLIAYDVTPHCKVRDGIKYLNWAMCIKLLRQHGAETVYFTTLTNSNGSSLFMSEIPFEDKNAITNRCYEIRIKVVIDDKEFEIQSPVMNGANPVKDNSMTQQRVWNAQTRAFVKAVAIHTGLGFDLWVQGEGAEDEKTEEDLSKHNILKVKERVLEVYTEKLKAGYNKEEIATLCGFSDVGDFEYLLKSFVKLYNTEGIMKQIPNDKR